MKMTDKWFLTPVFLQEFSDKNDQFYIVRIKVISKSSIFLKRVLKHKITHLSDVLLKFF